MYAYVGGNPVSYTDPRGKLLVQAGLVAVGVISAANFAENQRQIFVEQDRATERYTFYRDLEAKWQMEAINGTRSPDDYSRVRDARDQARKDFLRQTGQTVLDEVEAGAGASVDRAGGNIFTRIIKRFCQ